MRQMAFSKTIPQMQSKSKTVTRRVDTWRNLKPGTLLMAVEKGQGLAKGEKVREIGVIRVLSIRHEEASPENITADEIAREGFPGMTYRDFIGLLCVWSYEWVNRIEFEHVAP